MQRLSTVPRSVRVSVCAPRPRHIVRNIYFTHYTRRSVANTVYAKMPRGGSFVSYATQTHTIRPYTLAREHADTCRCRARCVRAPVRTASRVRTRLRPRVPSITLFEHCMLLSRWRSVPHIAQAKATGVETRHRSDGSSYDSSSTYYIIEV